MIQIEFKSKHETRVSHIFCKYIIKCIQKDFKSKRSYDSLQLRLDLLQYADWMRWIGKPYKIDARTFINYVCNSVSYTVRQNNFIIYIDDRKFLPGTYTPILKVLRYVDFGNELVPGCMFFSSILLAYSKKIYDYYNSFITITQSK